jgi:hypothetical protein
MPGMQAGTRGGHGGWEPGLVPEEAGDLDGRSASSASLRAEDWISSTWRRERRSAAQRFPGGGLDFMLPGVFDQKKSWILVLGKR